jgi:hemerythrin
MILVRAARPLIEARHALGHAKIDADHFAIADYWQQATTCPLIAVPFQIARLRKRMRRHFDDEAALIEAAGAPFCACHREEHDAMLQLCDDARLLSDTNARGARALLHRRLPRLMRAHIDGMDQIAVLMMCSAAEAFAHRDLHR